MGIIQLVTKLAHIFLFLSIDMCLTLSVGESFFFIVERERKLHHEPNDNEAIINKNKKRVSINLNGRVRPHREDGENTEFSIPEENRIRLAQKKKGIQLNHLPVKV